MTQPDIVRLRALPDYLRGIIKGQDHVIAPVCSVLQRGELGLANQRRPRGSFLFVGPTGVGKTEITNVFTEYLFPGEKPVRFDMSEYQTHSAVEKLIGEKVGDIGLLGRALQHISRGTLLFDEIEKAHPLVLDLFLQVLEDAALTLASGERKNLSNFYIVLTSNIGAAEAMRMRSAPFASVQRTVLSRVNQQLRPELVGRVTEKIVFASLEYSTQRAICQQMIDNETSRLGTLGVRLENGPEVLELLVREGYHRGLGARPMRAAVERHLQGRVANTLLGTRPPLNGEAEAGASNSDSRYAGTATTAVTPDHATALLSHL
jgi:ATP-dependent Clp protease ATP-binding subunit ClpB